MVRVNEGVAVDARLVQSASHPISEEDIKNKGKKGHPGR